MQSPHPLVGEGAAKGRERVRNPANTRSLARYASISLSRKRGREQYGIAL
jgi:hypothetical protein